MSSHASFPGEQLCSASLAASSVVEIVQNMYGDDLVVILYNSLQDAGELVSRIPELLSKWSSNDATATSVIPVKHRAQVSDLEDTEDPLDQGLLRSIPHADTCSADDSLFKRNTLKPRTGKETRRYRKYAGKKAIQKGESGRVQKPDQTFSPHCKQLQLPLKIPAHWRVTKSGRQFMMYNNVDNSVLIFCTDENLKELAAHSVWCTEGTFKIIPDWYQQLFTIHFNCWKRRSYCEIFDNLIAKAAALGVVLQPQIFICYFETTLIPAVQVQGSFPGVHVQGCCFHFCQAVLRKVADLGLRSRYLCEAETKKIIKMLVAAAFLPLAEQVTSGRVTANDLLVKNKKYEEVQLRPEVTAEYDGGTHTMEQFLKAIAYDVPEPYVYLYYYELYFIDFYSVV
ncbi:hypothetical protein T4A_139, partial [Trichinella pseudospiralis]